jgi:glutamate dehydrogenase (NADP+)
MTHVRCTHKIIKPLRRHQLKYLQNSLIDINKKYADQQEFIQAVEEVAADVGGLFENNKQLVDLNIFNRLVHADRIIKFRVTWQADNGDVHVNTGYRVQHSNLIGPYKGGLRFHPSVNESILKFLAFEQMFKNALTGLPIGGAKGGSDFDPSDKSEPEIMRFCQAFMNELYHYIGDQVDIPAGDINVGSREIGYLFGQHRRLTKKFSGAITGKELEYGGSHVRTEATGFGLLYFVCEMLGRLDKKIKDLVVSISGSGNVALHAALKAIQLGAKVITLSSSQGHLFVKDGFCEAQINQLIAANGSSTEKLKSLDIGEWVDKHGPWQHCCDIALPCATQNEVTIEAAKQLVESGCMLVAEGANMPCTKEAVDWFENKKVLHAPGKASNAGGVALSALEMGQNADFSRRSFAKLDEQLREIMHTIHDNCLQELDDANEKYLNYRKGANLAGFTLIASAAIAQGI